jgi:hypothetical protein
MQNSRGFAALSNSWLLRREKLISVKEKKKLFCGGTEY